ncbi:MAG: hypothetical protein ACSHYB_04425 [Roseibacillus sp.]
MSLKTKLLVIFVLVGVLSLGLQILRPDTKDFPDSSKTAVNGPKSSNQISTPNLLETEKQIASKGSYATSQIERVEPVTLDDISTDLTPEEATGLFQRLSTELIIEVNKLAENNDRAQIESRLSPIVQKFYYLNRTTPPTEDVIQGRLPSSYQSDIRNLEELWTNNPELATAVDDLFARFDLLDHEHVPYQLRNELTLH